MIILAVAISLIFIVGGLVTAFFGWRKWRAVDPLNPVASSPKLFIIGLALIVIGLLGVGAVLLKRPPEFIKALIIRPPSGVQPEAPRPIPFSVVSSSPKADTIVPRNSVVRVFFNQAVRSTDALRMRVVAVGANEEISPVPGSLQVENEPFGNKEPISGSIVFRPLLSCGKAVKDANCFAAKQQYRVDLDAKNIRNAKDTENLSCELLPCSFVFTTSDKVDTKAPVLNLPPTLALPIEERASLFVQVTDDSTISHVRLTLDRGQYNPRPWGVFPWPEDSQKPFVVSTVGLLPHSQRFITAEVFDIAGRKTELTRGVSFYKAHCFSGQKDDDEQDKDCGGADCQVCK